MKKFVVMLVVTVLMLCMTARAEVLDRWVFDPRISIDVVDHVDKDGCYSVYYSIAEEFVITLDRDVYNDTGRLYMTRGGVDDCMVYIESDWGGQEEYERIVDEWGNMALMMV